MQWQTPQFFPGLGEKQIHIWRTSLDRNKHDLDFYLSILDSQEKKRAAKYISKRAADNFIISRAVLRMLLASYLNPGAIDILDSGVRLENDSIDSLSSLGLPRKSGLQKLKLLSSSLIFQQNNYGKLYIESSAIQFNVSHSGGLAAFVFALDKDVGVDVEFIREDFEFADIAKRFFSKSECCDLFALPENEQLQGFFNCWSRKEAFVKALGTGLYSAFNEFSVGVSSSKKGKVGLVPPESRPKACWQLEAFNPGSQHSGAFVVDLVEYKAKFYDFL